jgi:hypothetical protein
MFNRLLSQLRRKNPSRSDRTSRRRFFEPLEERRVMALEAYHVDSGIFEITEGEPAYWIIDIVGTGADAAWAHDYPEEG